MTVFFNKARRKWMFNFRYGGKRYQGYCLLEDGKTLASCEWEARAAQERAKYSARRAADPDQTGFIYVFSCEGLDLIKIGWSKAPRRRLMQLRSNSPLRLMMIGNFRGTRGYEKELHKRFKRFRVKGEWFRCTPELLTTINAEILFQRKNVLTQCANTGQAPRDAQCLTG